jgi:hypothetical protein
MRQYEYIKVNKALAYGKEKNCNDGFEVRYINLEILVLSRKSHFDSLKIDSWFYESKWTFLGKICDHCFCICDNYDASKPDRIFSLREVKSDSKNNK